MKIVELALKANTSLFLFRGKFEGFSNACEHIAGGDAAALTFIDRCS